MRRTAVDFGVPLLTNMNLVKMFADSVYKNNEGRRVHWTQATDSL